LRILAEEVLANVLAIARFILLILPIDAFAHALYEQATFVLVEQCIPIVAPNHLDDVPAGADEQAFQLLNDLAVAADWTVEPLQVAIHHENQVVELLAARERDRAECFRFVGLPVTDKAPDLAAAGVFNVAVLEIFIEASLVNGHDRPQAHRYGRE